MTTLTATWKDRTAVATYAREHGVYLALLILVLYNVVATTNFVTVDTLQLLFSQLPPVIIVSLGMAMVIGTGGVDLSVGTTMAIASAVLAKAVINPAQGGFGAPIAVAIIVAITPAIAASVPESA